MNKQLRRIWLPCVCALHLVTVALPVSAEEAEDTAPETIVSAIQAASKLPAFLMNTDINLDLDGIAIKGEYQIHADVEAVQGEDRENFQMNMATTSDILDSDIKGYYQDGWYYSTDGKKAQKEEKSAEDVRAMITDVTAMVVNAQDQISDVREEKAGTNCIYTYRIPEQLAEDYLEALLDSELTEGTSLEHAKVDVSTLELVSMVDENQILIRQELWLTGDVKKLIFKVPAQVEVTADFTSVDPVPLQIPGWAESLVSE